MAKDRSALAQTLSARCGRFITPEVAEVMFRCALAPVHLIMQRGRPLRASTIELPLDVSSSTSANYKQIGAITSGDLSLFRGVGAAIGFCFVSELQGADDGLEVFVRNSNSTDRKRANIFTLSS